MAILESKINKFNNIQRICSLVLIISIFFFYIIPIILWLILLGTPSELPKEFLFLRISLRTIILSFIVSILAVLIAWPIAILWRFSSQKYQFLIVILLALPLATGLIARNYSWIGMLSNKDIYGSFGLSILKSEQILYTVPGIIFVMVLMFLPISFFILIQGTSLVKREYINSARIIGLTDWHIIKVIIFPLSNRSALLALGFNFAYAVGFFVTPKIIGGGTYNFIGNAILEYINMGDFSIASGIAIRFLSLISILIVLIITFALYLRWKLYGR